MPRAYLEYADDDAEMTITLTPGANESVRIIEASGSSNGTVAPTSPCYLKATNILSGGISGGQETGTTIQRFGQNGGTGTSSREARSVLWQPLEPLNGVKGSAVAVSYRFVGSTMSTKCLEVIYNMVGSG